MAKHRTSLLFTLVLLGCLILVFLATRHEELTFHLGHANNILRSSASGNSNAKLQNEPAPSGLASDASRSQMCPPGRFDYWTICSGLCGPRPNCNACTEGFKCPGDNRRHVCFGSHYQDKGGQSICIPCPPGTVKIHRSRDLPGCSPSGLNPCPPGSLTRTNRADTTCLSCPPGQQGVKGSCKPCGERYYNPTWGTACQRCPKGKKTSAPGATSINQCNIDATESPTQSPTPCPKGQYGSGPPNCQLCPVDYACPGDNSRIHCWRETYQNRPGQSFCIPCAAGTLRTVSHRLIFGCLPTSAIGGVCPSFSLSIQTTFARICISCPPGQSAGRIDGRKNCYPCQKGTYAPTWASPCNPCPTGKTTSGTGATSCDVAIKCQRGSYVAGSRCASCPINYRCPGDQRRYQCRGSVYQNRQGQTSCIPCPPGTSKTNFSPNAPGCSGRCPAGALRVQNTCLSCPPGQSARGNRCQPCNKDTYAPRWGSTCVVCPFGKTTSGSGATACNVNQHLNLVGLWSKYSSRMTDSCTGLRSTPCHGTRSQTKIGCISRRRMQNTRRLLHTYCNTQTCGFGDSCAGIAPNTCHRPWLHQSVLGYVWNTREKPEMLQLYRGYSSRVHDTCLGTAGIYCHDRGVMRPIPAWIYPPSRC